jgi:Fic/DOC family
MHTQKSFKIKSEAGQPSEIKHERRKSAPSVKIYSLLKKSGLLNKFEKQGEFESQLLTMDFKKFLPLLIRLNGLLRDKKIHDRSIDGKNVEIGNPYRDEVVYLPPIETDKLNGLEQTFEALKNISRAHDRAVLMYYAIQALHPFVDGNGRLGRLLFQIIDSSGVITQEEISSAVDRGKDESDISRSGRAIFAEKIKDPHIAYYPVNREVCKVVLGNEFINEYGAIYETSPIGVGTISADVANQLGEDAGRVKKILGEGDTKNISFRGIILAKLISQHSELDQYMYVTKSLLTKARGVLAEDEGKKMLGIDSEEMSEHLNVIHARDILEIHRQVKQEFMRQLIDIFEHPENHQVVGTKGEPLELRGYFTNS